MAKQLSGVINVEVVGQYCTENIIIVHRVQRKKDL